MANDRTVHELTVGISGKVESSLQSAIGLTEKELRKLSEATRTINRLTARQTSETFSAMAAKTDNVFRRMGRTAGTEFRKIGNMGHEAAARIKHAFEGLHEPLKKLGEFTGIGSVIGGIGAAFATEEFVKSSFEVHAERETLNNQLHALLENQGRNNQFDAINLMIRKFSDNESPVKFEPAAEMVAGLLANDPKHKFANIDVLHQRLGQLADISRDENTFKLAGAAYTKAAAQGFLNGQELRELSQDTKMPFREYIGKAMNIKPEELEGKLKKHLVTIDMLDKALTLMTGEGGVAHGHSLAQMTGLKGLSTRFEERWRDFLDAAGTQIENVISPVSEKILKAIGPAELLHAFDGVSGKAKNLGAALADLSDKFASSGTAGSCSKSATLSARRFLAVSVQARVVTSIRS